MKKSMFLIVFIILGLTTTVFSLRGPENGRYTNRDRQLEQRWRPLPGVPYEYMTMRQYADDSDGHLSSESSIDACQWPFSVAHSVEARIQVSSNEII